MLHSGHEYSAPQIGVLAVSGQTNNDSSMTTGQESNNNNNTAITLDQTTRNASNSLGPYYRERMERLAELESVGIEFSSYAY